MTEATPTNSAGGLNVFANALSCAVAIAALIGAQAERLLLVAYAKAFSAIAYEPPKLTQLFLSLGENGVGVIFLSIAAIPVAAMLLTRSPKWKIIASCAAAALLIGVMAALFLASHLALSTLLEISETRPK